MLKTDDYRRVLAVLEVAEQAPSLSALRRSTLEALDAHLGYHQSAFLTGTTDEAKVDGVALGHPQRRLDAFLARVTAQPGVNLALSGRRLDRTEAIDLEAIFELINPQDRHTLEDFLQAQGLSSLLGAWLDTGTPTQGLVCLLGVRPFSASDRERLLTLAPHLGHLLSHHLPRHVKVAAAPLLTPREAETVDLVAAGYSNRAIARRLDVTESTVKKHVSAALTKLDVTSRTQLTLAWLGGQATGGRGGRSRGR